MLVHPEDEGLLVLRQEDHAQVSGELAALLKDAPKPRSAFVAAARVHDNGWREADALPTLDAKTGQPHSYLNIPDEPYLHIWQRGIARAVEVDLHVGLLVSLHGMTFFQRSKSPLLRAFHDEERQRQDRMLRALGLGGTWQRLPEEVERQRSWIRFLDGLSLFVCGEWRSPMELEAAAGQRHRIERHENDVLVRPWPFLEAASLRIPALRLSERTFESETALRHALRDAQRLHLERRVRRG